MKDLLGADADLATKEIKKAHDKSKQRERLMVNGVYRAVKYFEKKMDERTKRLNENIRRSKTGTYHKPDFSWRDAYHAEIAEKGMDDER